MSKKSLHHLEKSEAKHFDDMAKQYDHNYHYDTPFHQYKIQKKLGVFAAQLSTFHVPKRLKILEVGCGTGEYTVQLAQRFPEADITAYDISPNIAAVAREKCRKFSNVHITVASAYNTQYKSETFDMVCGFYVLHHLQLGPALTEAHRVLKDGGYLFFYEPNLLNPIVLATKSIPYLKERAGDSPDEWAVNPLTLGKTLKGFTVLASSTTEFLPNTTLPFAVTKFVDDCTHVLAHIPLLNLLGGSAWFFARKQ
jgi:ubiquinone/menaquinone biosynthesis C-methylase UbiE